MPAQIKPWVMAAAAAGIFVGILGIWQAGRYADYRIRTRNPTFGTFGKEVYWAEARTLDTENAAWLPENAYGDWKAKDPDAPTVAEPDKINWSKGHDWLSTGYGDLTVAFGGMGPKVDPTDDPDVGNLVVGGEKAADGTIVPMPVPGPGRLASLSQLQDAASRGLTADRWGFFDASVPAGGQFGSYDWKPYGLTTNPTKPGDDEDAATTMTGTLTRPGTACQQAGQGPCTVNVPYGAATSWFPSTYGLAVALPVGKDQTPPDDVPPLVGGPYGADGSPAVAGLHQPGEVDPLVADSANAYMIGGTDDIHGQSGFETAEITVYQTSETDPSKAAWTAFDPFNGNWLAANVSNADSQPQADGASNPLAGFWVYGVKPRLGDPASVGVMPFNVQSGQWNDPSAMPTADTKPKFSLGFVQTSADGKTRPGTFGILTGSILLVLAVVGLVSYALSRRGAAA